MKPPNHRRTGGFTLIELMCSMAIGSVILLVAVTLLRSSGDGYESVGGSVASEREARALISQLASDLSTSQYQWNALIERSSAQWPRDRIGFLSLQPAQAQSEAGRIGDLCAVNYYLKDLTIGGRSVRCLMRGFRESADTFKALQDDKVATLFEARDQTDEPVAFGVVSFSARPMCLNDSGKWEPWSESSRAEARALEVKIVIARRDLTGRLKQPGDWDSSPLLGDPSKPEQNKNLETYSTFIQYGNAKNY